MRREVDNGSPLTPCIYVWHLNFGIRYNIKHHSQVTLCMVLLIRYISPTKVLCCRGNHSNFFIKDKAPKQIRTWRKISHWLLWLVLYQNVSEHPSNLKGTFCFYVNYTFHNHYINIHKLILNEKGRMKSQSFKTASRFFSAPMMGKINLKWMFIKISEWFHS